MHYASLRVAIFRDAAPEFADVRNLQNIFSRGIQIIFKRLPTERQGNPAEIKKSVI
jgi:hypothetical protein